MLATKRRPTQHVSSFFLNLENFNDHVTFFEKMTWSAYYCVKLRVSKNAWDKIFKTELGGAL